MLIRRVMYGQGLSGLPSTGVHLAMVQDCMETQGAQE